MPLEHEPYTWRETADGRLIVSWQGRPVGTLKGDEARRLSGRLRAADAREQQLLLARATGNFKRGNERA